MKKNIKQSVNSVGFGTPPDPVIINGYREYAKFTFIVSHGIEKLLINAIHIQTKRNITQHLDGLILNEKEH